MQTGKKKVIFLDRDGTINEDSSTWWKVDSFVLLDKVPEGLARLRQAGFGLAVVTNQAGVGRGLYTEQDVGQVHDYMKKLLGEQGVELDAIAYCPHEGGANCDCRKPLPGLAKQIEASIGPIDYAASWMIGDKDSDVGFGKHIGVKTALIKSGTYWEDKSELAYQPDLIVQSVDDFSRNSLILKS